MYSPLEPKPWKPVQFICTTYPNGEGIVTNGEAGYHDLDSLAEIIGHLFDLKDKGFVIYSMYGGSLLVDATASKLWEIHYWNGRVSHYIFAGKITIYPMSGISQNVESVWPFFTWLRENGIQAGSFTSMAARTWQLSLNGTVSFFDEAGQGRNALYGSRKEAIRGKYRWMYYQDLRAAFPSTMANNSFPRRVKETNRLQIHESGYALATVNIPSGLDWNPIPCRLGKRAVTYGFGQQTDWWTFEDLRHVLDFGGQVVIHRAFKGYNPQPIFRDWYDYIITPARMSLEGDAQLALKTLANRLWSSFAVGGTNKVARFEDSKRKRIVEKTTELRGMRYESYIACQVLALVRSRVLEALYTVKDPVYVDTDAIICSNRDDLGNGWRVKKRMATVEVHSCQNYKWECPRCGVYTSPLCNGPHYSLAMPASNRFEAEIALGHIEMPVNPLFGITVNPDDLTTLRGKFGYKQPVHPGADSIDWGSLREGTQQRFTV